MRSKRPATRVWRMVLRRRDGAIRPAAARCGHRRRPPRRGARRLLVLVGLMPIVGADVVTEYRGERALEALRAASAPRARVRRDGRVVDVPAAALVPGDIVLLRVGDVVPADLRLTRVERLVLDRSVLTGESVPEPASVEADPATRRSPTGGRWRTPARAWSAAAARASSSRPGPGPRSGGSPAGWHARSGAVRRSSASSTGSSGSCWSWRSGSSRSPTGLGFLRGNPAGENLLAGISAAIAAIPEEPPVLLAVVLGLGAYRLLRRGVLVRRLNAEEILGAVDLIVTDKTGTLTQNRLDVASVAASTARSATPMRRLAAPHRCAPRRGGRLGRARASATSSFTRRSAAAVEAAGGDARAGPRELVSRPSRSTDGRPYVDRPRPVATRSRGDAGCSGAPEAVADVDRSTRTRSESGRVARGDRGRCRGRRRASLARSAGRDGRAGAPWSRSSASPTRCGPGSGGSRRRARRASRSSS